MYRNMGFFIKNKNANYKKKITEVMSNQLEVF